MERTLLEHASMDEHVAGAFIGPRYSAHIHDAEVVPRQTSHIRVPHLVRPRSVSKADPLQFGQGVTLQPREFVHIHGRGRFRVRDGVSVIAVLLIE